VYSVLKARRGYYYDLFGCGHMFYNHSNEAGVMDLVCCEWCNYYRDQFNPQTPDKTIAPFTQKDIAFNVLEVGNIDEMISSAEKLLSRQSSLSVLEKGFLVEAMTEYSLKMPEKMFKETLPFVYSIGHDLDYVKRQLSGATDVLRIAYYVSDENSDLSLKQNVKFKLRNRHVRDFFEMLDSLKNLEEDFLRYRERWLRLGEIMHPAADKNRKKYPSVAKAFDSLRNYNKNIKTFNRSVEKMISDGDYDGLLKVLVTRPGEFARRLDSLLRTVPEKTLSAFSTVVDKVPAKTLYTLEKFFIGRDEMSNDKRVFVIKGAKTKSKIIDDVRPLISEDTITSLNEIVVKELVRRYSVLPKMGKVYIDPILENIVLPINKRGESEKTESKFTTGSRIPTEGRNVIRLFTWWKGNFDIDLSAVMFDENFREIGHCSFTNLRNTGMIHSGDVRSAPNGAFEFIDIDKKKLPSDVRYVATNVISFRGEPFKELECYTGFMERDSANGGTLVEPMSVKTKMKINGNSTSHSLFLFDVVNDEVVLIDMESGSRKFAHVTNSVLGDISREIVKFVDKKPTVFSVLEKHVLARGEFVDDINEADVVFDIDNFEFDDILNLM